MGTVVTLIYSTKKRFCRQMKCSLVAHQVVKPSITQTIYCGQHLDLSSTNTSKIKEEVSELKDYNDLQSKKNRGKRIPCPIDPSHTIYECNLRRHVLICPRAKQKKKEKK